MRCPPSHLLVPLILLISGQTVHSREAGATGDAYVTFLQDNTAGSVVGVRVLGQSLRETGTRKDCVVICDKDTTSAATIDLFSDDGWIVKFKQELTDTLKPESQVGSRVMTHSSSLAEKVIAWKMTAYHRVTLIDPDFAVLENIDRIFDCGSFCAHYKISDALFDTGVMVIQPSEAMYKNIMEKLISSEMMTEDSVLNEYFGGLVYEPMFNWSAQDKHSSVHARLSACLNADTTLYYMLNSNWLITDKLRIVRFSILGLVVPWDWKYYFFFELNWKWNDIRERLPYNVKDKSVYRLWHPLFWMPFVLLLSLYFAACTSRNVKMFKPPRRLRQFAKLLHQYHQQRSNYLIYYSFLFLAFSYLVTFQIIPTTLTPSKAEFALYMWVSSLFLGFLCLYNYAIGFLEEIPCQVGPIALSSSSTKKLKDGVRYARKQQPIKSTLYLFLPYLATYLLLRFVPGFIHPVLRRLISMLILLVVHMVVSCRVGQSIIELWSR